MLLHNEQYRSLLGYFTRINRMVNREKFYHPSIDIFGQSMASLKRFLEYLLRRYPTLCPVILLCSCLVTSYIYIYI